MFRIHFVGGRYCPVAICDACQSIITRRGNVEWTIRPGSGAVVHGPFCSHKGKCSRLLRSRYRELGEVEQWMWHDLDVHLFWLGMNTGINWVAAFRKAQRLATVGP